MKELGWDLIVHINQEGVAQGINPFDHGSAKHTDIMKTQALKQALDKHGFDAAFGGARRDDAGTLKTSAPSFGIFITARWIRGKVFVCSRFLIGPSLIFGNTFT